MSSSIEKLLSRCLVIGLAVTVLQASAPSARGQALTLGQTTFTLGQTATPIPAPPRRSYMDLQPGFRQLREKIDSGAPITVVYFGGSITDGDSSFPADPNYDRELHSWRARSFKFLRNHFELWPGQFTAINAALGGTGSHLGACRFPRDVAPFVPDLLLIEFTVNDAAVAELSTNPFVERSSFRTIKSIVEQARAVNPDVAIFCPLSTMEDIFTSPLSSQPNIELSRDHYLRMVGDPQMRLPFVDLTDAFYFEPLPLGLTVDSLYDGLAGHLGNAVHPAPGGHETYAHAVFNALQNLLVNPSFTFPASNAPLPAAPALTPYPSATPQFLGALDLPDPSTTGWILEEAAESEPIFEHQLVYRAPGPDSVFEIAFSGRSVALWWQIFFDDGAGGLEPFQGRIRIEIDGQIIGTYAVGAGVVPASGELGIGRFMEVANDLDPVAPHMLKIHVPPNQPPAMVGPVRLALHVICTD